MKPWLWIGSIAVCIAGVAASPPQSPDAVLVFTGDIGGYLSPCGCTKPQIGGIKRMAGVVRALLLQKNAVYVDAGNWTKAEGRQDELKAETIAGVMAGLKPGYLNIGPAEAQMGTAYVRALSEMAGGTMDSTNILEVGSGSKGKTAGKLWLQGIVGYSALRTLSVQVDQPDEALGVPPTGFQAVTLLSGPRGEAERLAASVSGPRLIVYSLQGDAPKEPVRVGDATLVTPGDHCRNVGVIELVDGKWKNFRLIELGPENKDDASASNAYDVYLKRVTSENLLATLPRIKGADDYVGTAKCGSCHARELKIWKKTGHAHALPTLEATGNHRDPDCVGCHVVGLRDKSGFVSKQATPNLANVGCENCHGPGRRHSAKSKIVKMGKVGEKACLGCHNPDNSPTFDFKKYWPTVKH